MYYFLFRLNVHHFVKLCGSRMAWPSMRMTRDTSFNLGKNLPILPKTILNLCIPAYISTFIDGQEANSIVLLTMLITLVKANLGQ